MGMREDNGVWKPGCDGMPKLLHHCVKIKSQSSPIAFLTQPDLGELQDSLQKKIAPTSRTTTKNYCHTYCLFK